MHSEINIMGMIYHLDESRPNSHLYIRDDGKVAVIVDDEGHIVHKIIAMDNEVIKA